jgi:tRNA(Ile)-lysidine synthase
MARKEIRILEPSVFTGKLAELIGADKNRVKVGKVLVALSGGPDSVALLHLMHDSSKQMGFEVVAAHVNYGLRGKESDDDEKFCRELCGRLGLKLHVKRANLSRKRKTPVRGELSNLQAEARRIRYEYFDHLSVRENICWIATGHNQMDNAETILMHLCRGAGTFGLTGIEPVAGKVIRPLLYFTREEIIGYLKRNRIPYRVDSSNLEGKYRRNQVRWKLLPVIVEIFGDKAAENINRSGQILAVQERFLRSFASKLLARDAMETPFGKIALDLRRFARYDDLLKRLVIALGFERLTGSLRDFDFAMTERVLEAVNAGVGKVDLKSGLFAEIAGARLYLCRRRPQSRTVAVSGNGTTPLTQFGISLVVSDVPGYAVGASALREGRNLRVYVDRKRMRGKLTIRTMRSGDRFTPLGMKGSKKLSDFFSDRKIDRPLREEIPLLLCGGKIVWIVGYEVADYVKITARTRAAQKLEVTPDRES